MKESSEMLNGQKETTCCVAGHRELPPGAENEIGGALEKEIRQAVTEGFTCFLTDLVAGTDLLFAKVVTQISRENADVRLEAVLPYPGLRNKLLEDETVGPLLLACADVHFSGDDSTPDSDSANRRELLRRSSRMIVVYDGREDGGTVSAIRMAHSQRVPIREIPLGL